MGAAGRAGDQGGRDAVGVLPHTVRRGGGIAGGKQGRAPRGWGCVAHAEAEEQAWEEGEEEGEEAALGVRLGRLRVCIPCAQALVGAVVW